MTVTAHLCSSPGGQSPAAGLCTWPAGTHIETGRSSRRRRRGASGRSWGSPGCSLCLCLGQLSRTWERERSKRDLKNSSCAEDSLLHRNPEHSENRPKKYGLSALTPDRNRKSTSQKCKSSMSLVGDRWPQVLI